MGAGQSDVIDTGCPPLISAMIVCEVSVPCNTGINIASCAVCRPRPVLLLRLAVHSTCDSWDRHSNNMVEAELIITTL